MSCFTGQETNWHSLTWTIKTSLKQSTDAMLSTLCCICHEYQALFFYGNFCPNYPILPQEESDLDKESLSLWSMLQSALSYIHHTLEPLLE